MPTHAGTEALPQVEELAPLLSALASPVRLRLLQELRSPQLPSELRIPAERDREGLRSDRILSRPAISQHLAALRELALVEKTEDDRYVVNHQRLFSALREVSRLATIRPDVEVDVEETIRTHRAGSNPPLKGPRLILIGGPREGHVFPLDGTGPWKVGRGRQADVRLDYDPHVSREHACVHEQEDGSFTVEPDPDATNPPLLDFRPIQDEQAPFLPGSVLAVGSSRLVLKVA